MSEHSIKQYFNGKTIFITGGTGFVGKALLEKLLRSCPELEKVYILIRPKKGKSPEERIEQITSSCIFDVLKKIHPENMKKIVPIAGDTSQLGLGLSDKDKQQLISEVQVFFHAAASVKFDDFLKDAIFTNIRSAREAALLALEMKKIEVFMHVSTTYCNIDNKKVVKPILYPPHGDWKKVILIAEKYDTDTLNVLSRKFIGDFPNTYTYTKQLAEHCVNDLLGGKIPAVIIRPSVVLSTMAEPFQGWLDNLNGPVGILIAGGSGVIRTVYADPEVVLDHVAVDNLVKAMIVAAWHQTQAGNKKELDVYNASKYNFFPTKMSTFVELGKKLYWDVPLSKKIWFPGNTITKCWYNYFFNVILFHVIPAVFIDLLLRIAGYPPMLVKIQRKIYIAKMAISHFMLNDWSFVNTNTVALQDSIPKKEKGDFEFMVMPDSDEGVYKYYLASSEQGRINLLKEDKQIKEKTRTMTLWMYYLDRLCHWMFYVGVFWLVFMKINILALIWNGLSTYWVNLK